MADPVSMPADQTARKDRAISPETPAAGGRHILLVDDQPSVLRVLSIMLERLGYRVTAMANSLDALHAFSAAPREFDLVITDLVMPDMTGDRLARAMSAIRPDLPIVLCSGVAGISPEKVCEMGIHGLLEKPVVKEAIAQTVRRLIGGTAKTATIA